MRHGQIVPLRAVNRRGLSGGLPSRSGMLSQVIRLICKQAFTIAEACCPLVSYFQVPRAALPVRLRVHARRRSCRIS
jgi:hypothetical protein